MRADDYRRIALGMEGAIEASHMGHPDFRAHGRIFATLHADNQHGMVRLTRKARHQAGCLVGAERAVKGAGSGSSAPCAALLGRL